jgi:HAD superfamily hydrolase (TIGR01458 family)
MIRAVLLDLAGVVYQGDQPLPGAVDAVASLRQAGLRLRFLTNTTRMPRRALLSRLSDMGIRIADEELFTPAQAASAWLSARRLSPHLLIHPALQEDFANLPASETEAVVIGDAADGFTYAALNAAFRKLLAGAEFLALARNRSFKDEDGELSLDTGAFVAALEYATKREAVLLGKPAPAFFKAALASTETDGKQAVMVGKGRPKGGLFALPRPAKDLFRGGLPALDGKECLHRVVHRFEPRRVMNRSHGPSAGRSERLVAVAEDGMLLVVLPLPELVHRHVDVELWIVGRVA